MEKPFCVVSENEAHLNLEIAGKLPVD